MSRLRGAPKNEKIARARVFIDELNARTVCAHCGVQSVEWHNPEHVELKRKHFRIGSMVACGASIERLQKELARCTPLCRSCHMKEDGRLRQFSATSAEYHASHKASPRPCRRCEQVRKINARGLCMTCYSKEPDQIAAKRAYLAERLAAARRRVMLEV